MKIARLILIATCCAAMLRPTYAAKAPPALPGQSSERTAKTGAALSGNAQEAALPSAQGKTPSEQESSGTSKNQRSSRANFAMANHLKQPPTNTQASRAREATKLHRPSATASSGAVNQPLVTTESHSQALRVRPSWTAPVGMASANNNRHLGVNPASIGGASIPNTQSPGAINGTSVSRKP